MGRWVEETEPEAQTDWPPLETQTVEVVELYFEDEPDVGTAANTESQERRFPEGSVESAKETIYNYVGELARRAPPEEALTAFFNLFLHRTADRPDVRESLDLVITAAEFQQKQGLLFLNRAFYSMCNPWNLRDEMTPYLNQLIARLNDLPDLSARDPLTRLLRRRLNDFSISDYGDCLRRQMRLAGYDSGSLQNQSQGVLGDLLADYFFLYRSTTSTPDIVRLESTEELLESGLYFKEIRKLEETYRAVSTYLRLRLQGDTNLVNPTRLSVAEFEEGLEVYHPLRKEGIFQQAQKLRRKTQSNIRYSSYKPILKKYLATSLNSLPQITRLKLNRDLSQEMNNIDEQIMMSAGITITLYCRLLDAVFLPNLNTSSILQFREYLEEAGSIPITSLLLSLVLASPMNRFNLENKLGFLYLSFEVNSLDSVQWIVTFFEQVNLALVVNAKHLHYLPRVSQQPTAEIIEEIPEPS